MKRTALLTGGSSGIGKAIQSALVKDDWNVLAPSSKELDLADFSSIETYTDRLRDRRQEMHALIHCTGIWHSDGQVLADIGYPSFTPEQIIKTMNVGVTGFMVLLNRLSVALQGGSVVGISGTFEEGGSGWIPYYTSKRALEDFIVAFAQEQDDLHAFGVSPADTATEAFAKHYPQYIDEAQSPEVVAKLVVDLILGDSGYASGDIIEIRDGEAKKGYHV